MLTDNNPKTVFGAKKPPLFHVPMTGVYKAGLAFLQGALKYGHFNWRKEKVSSSTYVDAAMRHIISWKEGENEASDTGIHHLAHATACLLILMDAQEAGTLIDNRDMGGTQVNIDEIFEEMRPQIERIYSEWGPK